MPYGPPRCGPNSLPSILRVAASANRSRGTSAIPAASGTESPAGHLGGRCRGEPSARNERGPRSECVRVDDQEVTRRIECVAAPVHAAERAREDDGSLHAGGRKQPFVAQTLYCLAA